MLFCSDRLSVRCFYSISNVMLCDNLPFKRVGVVVQRVRREAF